VCLIDVEDKLRRQRLREREGWTWSSEKQQALVKWAAWHRGHAADPQHQPEVIVNGSDDNMCWERWTGWSAAEPRWHTPLIDTSHRDVELCVREVVRWVERCRTACSSGVLPLRRGWVDRPIES
jgi:hypothetical protein